MSKLTRKAKVIYGLGDLSGNIMIASISFFLAYFFVKVGGISPFLAGIIFIVARLWDAITDYMMGRISDRTKSKYGKRRVYMLFFALPYGLAFMLLWLTPFRNDTPQMIRFLYFLGVYLVYNTTWTIVYIPYNSLTVNMTDDYDERTSLNGYRIVLANVGIILGAAVFALLADGETSILYGIFGSERMAYTWAGIIFGIIAFIVMFVCALGTRETNREETGNQKGFIQTLREFFRLKEFRNIAAYYVLSMVGFDIIMGIFIFFVNDTLGFGGGDTSMIFVALPLVIAILISPLWVYLSKRYSKHKVYTIAAFFVTAVLMTVMFIRPHSAIGLGLMCAGVGMGMSAIQILPFSSLPDVVEVDEYVNGEKREGAFYGITQFLYKFASGFSMWLVMSILGIFGYKETYGTQVVVQSDSALFAIRITLAFLPGIIFLVSTIFAYRANLGRDRFNQIKTELHKKNQSKE